MEKKYSREHSAMDLEALRMHAAYPPGKVALAPTKPVTTQYQLSLAYSPGVAAPCLEIADNEDAAYDYTAKGTRSRLSPMVPPFWALAISAALAPSQ